MINKDITILKLIKKIKNLKNSDLIEIVDYWDADLCAIGLKKENRLIYISTFNYIENNPLFYDFDLEIISNDDIEQLQILKSGRKVSEVNLLFEIDLFLLKNTNS